jgi:hypothetical protein
VLENLDPRTQSMAISVLTSYAKRWLGSSLYDRLGTSDWMRSLREMSSAKKYGAEFALAVTSAFLKERLSGEGIWRNVASDIVGDAGSEMARQLLADVRSRLRYAVNASADTDIADALLELDDDRLYAVLRAVAVTKNCAAPPDATGRENAQKHYTRSAFIDEDIEAAAQRLQARIKRRPEGGDVC